ncbi:MAG: non-hydrolyzing UDP-N-acetylglucosamine 2-epimerase, partial [Desulfobacteraceae bacterium]
QLIAAARPNFMKIAPLFHALCQTEWAEAVIVHTGQHYDLNMSDVFFQDLGLPEPHIHLGVGSGTHAEQTGQVMMAYEKVLMTQRPDLVVVVGDVNSTVAATLAAVKLGVKTAHLEAGLRSFDRTMPEEINRVVTDALVDILWTPSKDGDDNLIREGVSTEKIKRVGNIMIDSLEMLRRRVEKGRTYERYGLRPGEYGLVTLHRPANVDREDVLRQIVSGLCEAAEKVPLVFPVHPRTRKGLERSGLWSTVEACPGIQLCEPLGYVPFMNLVFNSRMVITDSGGIQEETTYLGIPCLTLRPNTERPITITQGTNRLCNPADFRERFLEAVEVGRKEITPIEFWDGKTAERVVKSIHGFFETRPAK